MKWNAILARFGLTSGRIESQQTLAAATRRQREALEEARRALDGLRAVEATLAGRPELAALRHDRVRLESALERVRLRVELFRSDRLSAGAGFVYATSLSRGGDSLASLTADTTSLVRAIETAASTFARAD